MLVVARVIELCRDVSATIAQVAYLHQPVTAIGQMSEAALARLRLNTSGQYSLVEWIQRTGGSWKQGVLGATGRPLHHGVSWRQVLQLVPLFRL